MNAAKLCCALFCFVCVTSPCKMIPSCFASPNTVQEELSKDAAEELFRSKIAPRIKMLRQQKPTDYGTTEILRTSEHLVDGKTLKMSWKTIIKKDKQYILSNEEFHHFRGHKEDSIGISNPDYYVELIKNPNGTFSYKSAAEKPRIWNLGENNLVQPLTVEGKIKLEELFDKEFVHFVSCQKSSEFVEYKFRFDRPHPENELVLDCIIRFDLNDFNPIVCEYTYLFPGEPADQARRITGTNEWAFDEHFKFFYVRKTKGENRDLNGVLGFTETQEWKFYPLDEKIPREQVYASFYNLPEPKMASEGRGRWAILLSCLFLMFGIGLFWFFRRKNSKK